MPGNNGADATSDFERSHDPVGAAGAPPHQDGPLPELARKAERAFYDNADRLKTRSREAAATATEQMELARRQIVERVNERPFTTTLSVLGAGFLIGMLFAGRRR